MGVGAAVGEGMVSVGEGSATTVGDPRGDVGSWGEGREERAVICRVVVTTT